MNTNQFIKESVFKMLEEMKSSREQGNVKEYATLLDSLMQVIGRVHGSQNQVYLQYVKNTLKEEEEGVSKQLDISMEKKLFKDYRRWILVFEKLNKIHNDLSCNQVHIDMKKLKDEVKGKYVFMSDTVHDASWGAMLSLQLDPGEIELGSQLQFKNVRDYQITVMSMMDDLKLSGIRGDVLCVRRGGLFPISFKRYMKEIDPHVGNFKYVASV